MEKQQRLDYQNSVEKYLQKNMIQEKFKSLMQNLVINQPDDPIKYLIEDLSKFKRTIIFIVGPPSSETKNLSKFIQSKFQYHLLSTENLLTKATQDNTIESKQIKKCMDNRQYVPDDLVNQTVLNAYNSIIYDDQYKNTNLVIEGYPKTRVQGLFLQRNGIIPDQLIIVNEPQSKTMQNVSSEIYREYNLNITQTIEIYNKFYFQLDSQQKDVQNTLERLLKFKLVIKGPKQISKILIVGPPASGRTLLCKNLSERLNLVSISTQQLLVNQIHNKTKIGIIAQQYIEEGKLVPDDIMTGLVYNRINQTDAAMKGFVIDGFPKNIEQFQLLNQIKLDPSLIICLECDTQTAAQRLNNRKIDPITGTYYDQINPCNNPVIYKRLTSQSNETKDIIKQRLERTVVIQKHIIDSFQGDDQKVLTIDSTKPYLNVVEIAQTHLENMQ